METTIKNSYQKFKIDNDELYDFIDTINDYYTTECLELSASESDIVVYDESVDTEDKRDPYMVRLVRWWFLEEVLFAYTSSEDSAKWLKYTTAMKERKSLMSKMSYDRVTGQIPAETKTENSFSTITRYHGEG